MQLYEWANGKFAPQPKAADLDLPETPRSFTYFRGSLIVGFLREYQAIDAQTGDMKDITGATLARDTRPLVKLLPGERALLTCANEVGVCVGRDGKPVAGGPPSLQFSARPLSIAYCFPYILSLGENVAGAAAGVRGAVSAMTHAAQFSIEVHPARGDRDEVIQTITLPSANGAPVALVDGRAGHAGVRFEGAGAGGTDGGDDGDGEGDAGGSTVTGRGRNAIYVAWASPARIARLQPVPVDSQVASLLGSLKASAALSLILHTAVNSATRLERVARLNIDAGRALFLGLHFEPAAAFLIASAMDPREVLGMFGDVLPGACGPLRSLRGSNSSSHDRKANADAAPSETAHTTLYEPYAPRYFTASLTMGVALGSKSHVDAVNESADESREGATAVAISSDAGRVMTGLADISAIVSAQLGAYQTRMREPRAAYEALGEAHVPDVLAGAPLNSQNSDPARERLIAAYECALSFVRARRSAVRDALRVFEGYEANDAESALNANAAAASTSVRGRPFCSVTRMRGPPASETGVPPGFIACGSSWVPPSDVGALRALRSLLDGALVRLLLALGHTDAADAFVFSARASAGLDVRDTARALAAAGAHHTRALLFVSRGLAREAAAVWQALGDGSLVERVVRAPVDGARPLGGGSDDDSDEEGTDNAGTMCSAGAVGGRARRPGTRLDRGDGIGDVSSIRDLPVYKAAVKAARGCSSVAEAVAAAAATASLPSPGGAADETALAVALAYSAAVRDAPPAAAEKAAYDGVADTIAFLRGVGCDDVSAGSAYTGQSAAAAGTEQLLWDFSPWILTRAPLSALSIFSAPRGVRTAPNDDAVLEFLSSPARGAGGPALARAWLEAVVFGKGSRAERHHTRLAKEYLSALTPLVGGAASRAGALMRPTARPVPGTEGGELGTLRGRLVRLLQETACADAVVLRPLVPADLKEEAALVAARAGRMTDALRILAFELADHDRAVRLVQRRGASRGHTEGGGGGSGAADGDGDATTVLLRLYLAAHADAKAHTPTQPRALLDPHASVHLSRALELLRPVGGVGGVAPAAAASVARALPTQLPLTALLDFAHAALPASAAASRAAAVSRALYNFSYIAEYDALAARQSRSVVIARTTVCVVCEKRIGDAVFSCGADRRARHLHCARDGSGNERGAMAAREAAVNAQRQAEALDLWEVTPEAYRVGKGAIS